MVVSTLEGRGGSSLIFCLVFQVCMYHRMLGVYQEQELDRELDIFQVTMWQIIPELQVALYSNEHENKQQFLNQMHPF